jgi:hypothetical protein
VKEMHIDHLELYNDFIEKNAGIFGLNDKKTELKEYIKKTISHYKEWKVEGKDSVECF